MFKVRTSKQMGFTLVELGIVLSLIGIGLFFAITKMSETSDTNRAQTASRDLTQIIINARRLYRTQTRFPAGTWDEAILIRNNVFPPLWVDTATNVVRNPFGGEFRIDTQPDNTIAAIVLGGVPSKVCSELGQAMSGGVLGMWAGGGPAIEIKSTNSDAVNLRGLALGCTQAPNVTMAFFFGRNN
jgi:type II secretory pathway pseudopilin PulG